MNTANVIQNMSDKNHEQVVFCNDPLSGLKAIIAIHNTKLGPGLGGCRMYPYASEADALRDALRLSRGMTYKAALSNLPLGGAKSVIIGNPQTDGSELLFRAFGKFVQTLGGRYITAEDVGTDTKKMEWIRMETKHVVGLPDYAGGLGDPSPYTAHGVLTGIKASLKKLTNSDSLAAKTVAVQGVGHVGYYLCKELHEHGAKLIITDVNQEAVKRVVDEFKATAVKPDEIHAQNADIFAPCALGGVLTDKTIPQLKCKIVCGGANNQLEDEKKHGQLLSDKGILYAPDYVVNAGGLICVATADLSHIQNQKYALAKTEEIYNSLLNIFSLAEKEKISIVLAAEKLAEKRISSISQIKQLYSQH